MISDRPPRTHDKKPASEFENIPGYLSFPNGTPHAICKALLCSRLGKLLSLCRQPRQGGTVLETLPIPSPNPFLAYFFCTDAVERTVCSEGDRLQAPTTEGQPTLN